MHIGSLYRFEKKDWVKAAGNLLISKIKSLLVLKGEISIAISGGATPMAIFEHWTVQTEIIDWSQVKIFWVDERCVESTSKDSNYGNSLKYLEKLSGIQLYPMFKGNPENFVKIASEYEETIIKQVNIENGIPAFDLIILGMGLDGHYASLFQNSKGVLNSKDLVIVNWVEKLKQNRLTFTSLLINQASEIVVLINEIQKNKVLADAIFHNVDIPIQSVIKTFKNTSWIFSI